MIAYADVSNPPTQLQNALLIEPGIAAADLFDASAGTPSLALLQQYDIVVPFSQTQFNNTTTIGNNLADYVDGGGIVIQFGLAFIIAFVFFCFIFFFMFYCCFRFLYYI